MRVLFLSHSGHDKAYAEAIGNRLQDWGYESIFLYWDERTGIAAGTDWTRELYQKLRMAGALIAVYTPSYFDSKWCFAELTAARLLGKPVIPLQAGEAKDIPADLQAIQAIDYQEDAATGFPKLERALRLAGLAASDDFAPDPKRPPYPGLAALEAEDAPVFFGRQPEISAALQALQRIGMLGDGGLFVIAGASGSGKSSLLRAGILPRLNKTQNGRWLILPTLQPRQGFSLLADLRATLECPCVGREDVLASVQEICRDRRAPGAMVVLAIDQFEQLFADTPPPDAAETLALLASLARRPTPIVLISVIRSDFLDRFQTDERLRDLECELFSLGLMPAARFVEVVQGPADTYGLVFEPPTLAQRIAGEAGTDEALPLLAFALRALWEPARREGVIRESLYESLFGAERGGLSGAVARTADQIVGGLDPGPREALRRAFVQLVRFDLNEKPVRRQARWSDMPLAARSALGTLVDARLLTSRGEGQDRFIDVAHESLFRVWPMLAGWIRDDRAFHIWNRNLLDAVQLWKRDQANTLKGKALIESEQWLGERADDLAPDMRQFITASIAERTRESRRKKVWLSAALAGVVIAIGAVIYSLYGEVNRQRELALRALVARARVARAAAVDGEAFVPDLLNRSLLLAVEADRTRSQPDTLEVLEEGLSWTHHASVSVPTSTEGMLAFSDGGQYLARVGGTGVEIIDSLGKTLFEVPVSPSDGNFVLWAAQSPILVVVTTSGLHVWDVTRRRETWSVTRSSTDSDSDCGFRQMQTSLDAQGRYVSSVDGSLVKIWDLRSGVEVFSSRQPEPLCNVAVSPGARYLALTDLGRDKAWLIDRTTGRRLTIPLPSGNVMWLAFDPAWRRLLTATTADVDLWEWDAEAVARVRNLPRSNGSSPVVARFGEDGSTVGLVGEHNDAASVPLGPRGRAREFTSVVIGVPLGGVVGLPADRGFSVFDLTIGRRVAHVLHAGGSPEFFAFDAHSGRVAFSSDDRLWIYDTQGGQERGRYRAPAGAEWLGLDETRRFSSLARDSEVFVVDTETAGELARIETPAPPVRVTVNADGSRAATFDESGTLTVWDLQTSRQLWAKEGIPRVVDDDDDESVSNVKSVEFSEDGQQIRLNAREQGGTWEAGTGRSTSKPFPEPTAAVVAVKSLEGRWSLGTDEAGRVVRVQDDSGTIVSRLRHDARVSMFRFSSDGHSIVTASDDAVLRVWRWRPEDVRARVCEVISRSELTQEEWQDAFGTRPRDTTCPTKTP